MHGLCHGIPRETASLPKLVHSAFMRGAGFVHHSDSFAAFSNFAEGKCIRVRAWQTVYHCAFRKHHAQFEYMVICIAKPL